jgi:hypothetical protein
MRTPRACVESGGMVEDHGNLSYLLGCEDPSYEFGEQRGDGDEIPGTELESR